MRASFPVEFSAILLGKSREAGSFDTPDGEVKYGDAYELSFESSEGLVQTCRVSEKQLDKAADVDISKLPPFTPLLVRGDVSIGGDRGGSFRPSEVRIDKSAASVAKAA